MIFAIFLIAALGAFGYFVVITARPMLDMLQNRLLYRSYLSRAEQAVVEKDLSNLARVIVMCDRVDPPTSGFLDAVKDNFSTGVRYVFLVSSRATTEEIERYVRMFEKIEVAIRAEQDARAELPDYSNGARIGKDPLFEMHRLNQEWNDYPYICYEFFSNDTESSPQYLMYRGSELGVGIASEYVRISPETAYSLIKRADALKQFIAAERDHFVDGRAGTLSNEPLVDNVVSIPSRAGGGR
jgi:hypothetical protein